MSFRHSSEEQYYLQKLSRTNKFLTWSYWSITLLESISSRRGGILDIRHRHIGCFPFSIIIVQNKSFLMNMGCIKSKNMAVEFNRQLKQRVIKLRAELPEAAITFADAHAATYELTRDAKELGRHFLLGYFCLIHDDIVSLLQHICGCCLNRIC